jgi:hypothetical protein
VKRVALLALVLAGPGSAGRAEEAPDFLPPPPPRSETVYGKDAGRPGYYQSPQRFAVELKFGPYSPDIDSSPGLRGRPFGELFNSQYDSSGKPNPRYADDRPHGQLLTSVEFDWQFWHGFGSLGVGGAFGIQRRTTHGFRYIKTTDSSGNPVYTQCRYPVTSPIPCERSGDETALAVMPFTLELVYRFDVLARRWRVPLVPYFKGGLAYYLWWIENGSGGLASGPPQNPAGSPQLPTTDQSAIGGSFGLVLHPGLAFLLDILDPATARIMDAELGINHAYVFAELNYAWATSFGAGGHLDLSDLTWNLGLAFEF